MLVHLLEVAVEMLHGVQVHEPFGELEFVRRSGQRRQPLQVLQTPLDLTQRQIRMLQVGQIGGTDRPLHRESHQAFDEKAAPCDVPGQAVARQQVLPGLPQLPLLDPQHRPGHQGLGQLPAELHTRQQGIGQECRSILQLRGNHRVVILRPLARLDHHRQRLLVDEQPVGKQGVIHRRPRPPHRLV